MNRRSFLKGLLGLGACLLLPIPKLKEETPTVKWGDKTLAYKGKTSFEAGYVYCPYIPLQLVRISNETIHS